MDTDKITQQIDTYQHRIALLRNKLVKSLKAESPGEVYSQNITQDWAAYHGDCIPVVSSLPTDSIHYSIFSPPFLSLYVYSDDPMDMGNSKTDDEFYNHFSYLIPQLLRVLMPGRLVSVHCSIIPMTMQHEGVMGLKDFPGQIVRMFTQAGFIYHSKVMIWKDPLLQAVRTKMLNLAHKQISKDSSRCGQGFADEILTFRKPGNNPEPVAKGRGFEQYIGEQQEPQRQKVDDPAKNKYSHFVWQRYASPVWMDIKQTDTLNVAAGREDKDERHICPLQLQAIARCLELWTNEGDTVLSPFAGIGSEGFESIKMNRKFIGVELKQSYYQTMLNNLKRAKRTGRGLIYG